MKSSQSIFDSVSFAALALAGTAWMVVAAQDGRPSGASGDFSARRAAFLRLIDRARVPLSPQLDVASRGADTLHEHFTIAAQMGERIPGIVSKAEGGRARRPAIIILHGTGGSKEDARSVRLSETLAGRGFIAVSVDGRYHGERAKPGQRAAEYVDAILRAYRTGREHPFLYDTVWDVMRVVDYLVTRDDVDPARIGLTGISKGGMETYLAAAVDPRIAAAVPVIGVQSFRWALDHDSWQSRVGTFQTAVDRAAADAGVRTPDAAFIRRFYDRVAPGIYGEFDAPAMLPLISPRPLLVISGDSDPRTPLPGVRESLSNAEQAYAAANASERLSLYLQPDTAHAFTKAGEERMIEWFVRWLKP